MTTTFTLWRYDDPLWADIDLVGYSVEALDGSIGKVDEASTEVGARYLVVDTGPWIFGKKVLIPAGVIRDIDPDTETILVSRTKDEIKNAPEFDAESYRDTGYRSQLSSYYGEGGPGYRAWGG